MILHEESSAQNEPLQTALNQLMDQLVEATLEFRQEGDGDGVYQIASNSDRLEVISAAQLYHEPGKKELRRELSKMVRSLKKAGTNFAILCKPPSNAQEVSFAGKEIVTLAKKLIRRANQYSSSFGRTVCQTWQVNVSSILSSLISMVNCLLVKERDIDNIFRGSLVLYTGMVWEVCECLNRIALNNTEAVRNSVEDSVDMVEDAGHELSEALPADMLQSLQIGESKARGVDGADTRTTSASTSRLAVEVQDDLHDGFDGFDSGIATLARRESCVDRDGGNRVLLPRQTSLVHHSFDVVNFAERSLRALDGVLEQIGDQLSVRPAKYFHSSIRERSEFNGCKLDFADILRYEDRLVQICQDLTASVDEFVISLTIEDKPALDNALVDAKAIVDHTDEILEIGKALVEDFNEAKYQTLVKLHEEVKETLSFLYENDNLRLY